MGSLDSPSPESVAMGVDRLLTNGSSWVGILEGSAPASGVPAVGGRMGLVTSDGAPPGLVGGGSSRKALLDAGVPITRLFTPEHGLSARGPDGSPISDGTDPETGLPVVSLYGPRAAPDPSELRDLDLVLFDLQDAGARFYTFLWTLSHVMEGCARAGVPLRILDRPNPLGGLEESVEGPVQDGDAPPSLLGRWPIPIRHSLTLGEMALLLKSEMGMELDLGVVAMEGWSRKTLWPETGLPFHPPSPGIPSFPSALLYPGLALLEATNLREGRGSELAFQWFGAPWLDPDLLAEHLEEGPFPGVLAHPLDLGLSPSRGLGPGPGEDGEDPSCPGILLEVTDPGAHRPVALGLRLLALLITLWPDEFSWAPYPTAANPSGEDHLQRLLGSRALASAFVSAPETISEEAIRDWTTAEGWWERAEPHLLYS